MSLESETLVVYGHVSCSPQTREWLHCRDLVAIVNCRPVFSSERVPHANKPALSDSNTNLLWTPAGCLSPKQTRRLALSCDIIFILNFDLSKSYSWH